MEATSRQVSKANHNKNSFGNPFKMIVYAILSKPTLIRQSSPRTVKHVTEIIQDPTAVALSVLNGFKL